MRSGPQWCRSISTPSSSDVPGRALGIDFGTRRIGYAVSDELGWVAEPLEVWARRGLELDLAHLLELCARHEIRRIVIGMPYHLDGRKGESAERAEAFVETVRRALPAIPTETIDEALTSWEADERLKARRIKPEDRKRLRDAYAAAVLLQEYLDTRRDD